MCRSFVAVLAIFWLGVAFILEGCLQCFGGCGILEGCVLEGCHIFEAVLAVFRRGVAFLRRCLQCFRRVWHF